MKNLVLLITLTVFVQIGGAQVRVECMPGQPKLIGHIKQIIEYNYINPRNIDSLKNPVKVIKDFDEKGNQLDEITYNKLEKVKSKTVFDNSRANTVIQSCNDSKGDLMWKTISKYDNNGNEIEMSNYPDTTTGITSEVNNFKLIYKYDDRNNVVEMTIYSDGNKLSSKEIFIYNENHQIIENHSIQYLPNRTSESKELMQYDADGNKITSKIYTSDGKLKTEHIILYNNIDEEGNWLTETEETKVYNMAGGSNMIKSVTKRDITYFK